MDLVLKLTTQGTLEGIIAESLVLDRLTKDLKQSLNNNYLRITRSIASRIQTDEKFITPEVISEYAKFIGVDEIHVVDSEGILYAGNIPGFFGFDFNTNDQTKPFLKILSEPSFELAQEPQLRGTDSVLFQYIGVAVPGTNELVQIGIRPVELQKLLDSANIQVLIE